MATFIDEQGGTDWASGSHSHFRLTAAWLPTAQVESFQESVRKLRKSHSLRTTYEFKFSKTHNRPGWRSSFYKIAMEHDLRFTTCALDKKRIPSGSIAPFMFYQVCATSLAAHLRETYRKAEAARCAIAGRDILLGEPVIVDDNKDPNMLKAIDLAFRGLKSSRNAARPFTKRAKFRDSEHDEGVQLADMVMGAVGAHLDGDSFWYNLIREFGDLGVVEFSCCQTSLESGDLSG